MEQAPPAQTDWGLIAVLALANPDPDPNPNPNPNPKPNPNPNPNQVLARGGRTSRGAPSRPPPPCRSQLLTPRAAPTSSARPPPPTLQCRAAPRRSPPSHLHTRRRARRRATPSRSRGLHSPARTTAPPCYCSPGGAGSSVGGVLARGGGAVHSVQYSYSVLSEFRAVRAFPPAEVPESASPASHVRRAATGSLAPASPRLWRLHLCD